MPPVALAFFITPHGFGHASRAAALMAALMARRPDLRFEIFTTVPPWIFAQSLQASFGYHPLVTDVGMVQRSPFEEDPPATCRELDRLLPFDLEMLDDLVGRMDALNCRLVLCDIAALGIAAAHRAGLKAVLIENFTWELIYRAYAHQAPGLWRHIDYLHDLYNQVDFRIQAQPVCNPLAEAAQTAPIARTARTPRSQIREQLGISGQIHTVLISLGGVPDSYQCMRTWTVDPAYRLVVAGLEHVPAGAKNILGLPTESPYYHPDLVSAADVVIAKAGYSTVAEAFFAGVPLGFMTRTRFIESAVLERFIRGQMSHSPISLEDYRSGRWLRQLPQLLAQPRRLAQVANGAESAADLILQCFAVELGSGH